MTDEMWTVVLTAVDLLYNNWQSHCNLERTRSSATAEKQRVSCACLPRLANWSCNAQNTAESQSLYYFWHSNALIQEVLAENAFCHEIAAQGHSRSIICRSTRGSISSHIIACHICEVFEEVLAENVFWEPLRISAWTLYFQKLDSLAYIFVADSMGLSSFKFVQWAPKDASFLRQSAFWPFKVIQVQLVHPRSMILVPIESAYATSY